MIATHPSPASASDRGRSALRSIATVLACGLSAVACTSGSTRATPVTTTVVVPPTSSSATSSPMTTSSPPTTSTAPNPVTVAWPVRGQAALTVVGGPDLGSHGAGKPAPIASMAKLMTVYVLLHRHPRLHAGSYLTITAAEVRDTAVRRSLDESLVPVKAGERLTQTQTLEAILLPSANNIAVYAGVAQLGSQAALVKAMNATAAALGMTSTRYTDPSGYTATTVSTAADQLRLMKAAVKVPELVRVAGLRSATIPVAGTITNTAPVGPHGFLAAKTGSDDAAGGCLVFAERVRVGSRTRLVLGVVMGQTGGPLIAAAVRAARRLSRSVGPNAG